MLGRTALLAALVGLLLVASACGDEGAVSSPTLSLSPTVGPSPSPTPSRSPSPASPTPTPASAAVPAVIEGVAVRPLVLGDEIAFPDDLALILETGCWQCDGPTGGFLRVYRDPSGQLRTDTLISMSSPWLPRRIVTTKEGTQAEEQPYVTGFAVRGDASEMVVSVCVRQSCGSGGLDAWSGGAETLLIRSTDGGVSWQEMGRLKRGGGVISFAGPDELLVVGWEAELAPPTFYLYPGDDRLTPPVGAPDAWPLFAFEGQVIWQSSAGKLVRGDGSTFVDLGPGAYAYAPFNGPDASAALTLPWSWDSGTSPHSGEYHYYLTDLSSDGRIISAVVAPDFLVAGARVAPDTIAANVGITEEELSRAVTGFFLGILPAIADLEAGVVNPIAEPFLEPDYKGGRSLVRALQWGPFARVLAPGSCLNVRAEPSLSARALQCAADGVLLRGIGLRHAGETVGAEGVTWLYVRTPDGVEGWASTAFLGR